MSARARSGSKRRLLALLGATLGSLLTGCSTYYDARFEPSPLEMRIEDDRAPGVLARGLATVRGVRRPDDGKPAQFDVLLRVENVGPKAFDVELESFQLVTANLESLGPGLVKTQANSGASLAANSGASLAAGSGASLAAGSGASLAAGDVRQFEVAFPLPKGRSYRDLDLSGLALRWTLRAEEVRVIASGSFHRRLYPNSPYFYGNVFWIGPGFGRYSSRVGTFCAY
jgi:hypothetical protein